MLCRSQSHTCKAMATPARIILLGQPGRLLPGWAASSTLKTPHKISHPFPSVLSMHCHCLATLSSQLLGAIGIPMCQLTGALSKKPDSCRAFICCTASAALMRLLSDAGVN